MPDPLPAGGSGPRGRIGYLLDALRLRPAGRRALSLLVWLLFVSGAGMFAYPLVTDVYATEVVQQRLEARYQAPESVERYTRRTVETGDPLTRIVMADIDVSAVVVEGISPDALRAGAGHFPTTPLPGEDGNVALAGHRTTYGKPFNRLDELGVGAEIRLQTPLATHLYRVVGPPPGVDSPCANNACWVVDPTDWGVVEPTDAPMLTLVTCTPKGSARYRLILRAELVDSTPRV